MIESFDFELECQLDRLCGGCKQELSPAAFAGNGSVHMRARLASEVLASLKTSSLVFKLASTSDQMHQAASRAHLRV